MQFHCKILLLGFLVYFELSNGNPVKTEPSTTSSSSIAGSIASLGRKLLTTLESVSKPNENLLISPANIFHAVSLLHMAACGNTLKDLSKLMDIPVPNKNYSKSDFHSAVSAFYKGIVSDHEHEPWKQVINIADALFLQNGFSIKKDYLNNATKKYQAQVENVDFSTGNEAVNKINSWVSQKTKERITKLVDSLESDTKAVIASTLYFRANWDKSFLKEKTRKEKFFTGENEVEVQMMNRVRYLNYVNNTELQFESIDIPYQESDYVLNVILPYPNQTIKTLIPKLKSINEIMEKSQWQWVDLKFPKTKLNMGKSLVEIFKHLGVQNLFRNANLTDLTDAQVAVSEILHSAEIEIHEEGTVATAATMITISLRMGEGRPRDPLLFHINRPFIINIYKKNTPLNLFSGIVYKPIASS